MCVCLCLFQLLAGNCSCSCNLSLISRYLSSLLCAVVVDAAVAVGFSLLLLVEECVIIINNKIKCLEALSVDNGWAGLVVFLLGDPHLLEGG